MVLFIYLFSHSKFWDVTASWLSLFDIGFIPCCASLFPSIPRKYARSHADVPGRTRGHRQLTLGPSLPPSSLTTTWGIAGQQSIRGGGVPTPAGRGKFHGASQGCYAGWRLSEDLQAAVRLTGPI
jgi:hypothetical protein